MSSDEQAIRSVIAEWMRASKAGDWLAVRRLMAEDVVFLTPGQPPLRGRETFRAGFEKMQGKVDIEGHSEVLEVEFAGSLAYCWTKLSVAMTPAGGQTQHRAGHTLSIFRREPAGNWVLFRDANLLAPVPPMVASS